MLIRWLFVPEIKEISPCMHMEAAERVAVGSFLRHNAYAFLHVHECHVKELKTASFACHAYTS